MKTIFAALLFASALTLPPLAPLAEGQSAKFTTLYEFSIPDNNGDNADGFYLNGGLVPGSDANFYGTAIYGGPYAHGTAFKVTPGGTLIVLQRFGNNNGANPQASLLLASDGSFYGTTYGGGSGGSGTIFKLTASGKFTALHRFNGTADGDGAKPNAALIQGSDGNFYGTTTHGGTHNEGTVYQMTPGGAVTVLHQFNQVGSLYPFYSPVTMGSDGNLYGEISAHSNSDQGYFYRVTTSGTFDILYSFDNVRYNSALVEVTPGVFYGTTGIIFKLTSDGKFSVVPLSNAAGPVSGVSTGGGALLLANDGKLYGVGKNNAGGIIFSVQPDGSDFTILYQGFTGADGLNPAGPLGSVQAGVECLMRRL